MVRILKLCADYGIERVAEAAKQGSALSLDSLRRWVWTGGTKLPAEAITSGEVYISAVDLKEYDRLLEHVGS